MVNHQEVIEKIRTRPFRELPLCGVHLEQEANFTKVCLSRVDQASLRWKKEWEMPHYGGASELRSLFRSIADASRGLIPVAWGWEHRSHLLWRLRRAEIEKELDLDLCFLLRHKSRWLDPKLWVFEHKNEIMELGELMEKLKVAKVSPDIDVARAAYFLPTTKGFRVSPEFTVREACDWQELMEWF